MNEKIIEIYNEEDLQRELAILRGCVVELREDFRDSLEENWKHLQSWFIDFDEYSALKKLFEENFEARK